jgi:hypothetical protein
MKKNIFAIVVAAMALFMTSCDKTPITPVNGENDGAKPRVAVTADLIGTDWTASLTLNDLLTGMGVDLSGIVCSDSNDLNAEAMSIQMNFDNQYAHITFSDNVVVLNALEVNGEYTMEEISQMDLAYVYDGATHTGTLTAVGTDENGDPINYQINFTYSDNDDTITINFQFTDENDAVITFPMVFQRDAVVA